VVVLGCVLVILAKGRFGVAGEKSVVRIRSQVGVDSSLLLSKGY